MSAILEKEAPASTREKSGRAPGSVPWLATAALWAVVLFAAINLGLWVLAGEDKGTSKDLWSGSGSIDLALGDLAALERRPSVVLLGSSLVMYPFWAMDKEMAPGIPDIFHHHASFALEKELERRGWRHPSVFSLAIFGQMASDGYIYVDEFLKGEKQPQWVVLGIAPRDFSDHDLPAPMATMTFKRLVGLSNFWRYASHYMPGWQDKADFLVSHLCFFYGKRWRLQHEVEKAVDKIYKLAGWAQAAPAPAKTEEQAGFMLAGSDEERWTNSINEYRRRYRNIGEKDLSLQMSFLNKALETCRDRGIKVVVVNMPLTDMNRSLFPPGFYDSFRAQIKQIGHKPGVTVLDLGDSPEFVHGDFWDTTHLNHSGGHKLLKRLAPLLTPS